MTTTAVPSSTPNPVSTPTVTTENKTATQEPSSSAASLSQEEKMRGTNVIVQELKALEEAVLRNRVEKLANIDLNIKANNFRKQDLPLKVEGVPIWPHLLKNGLVPRSHSSDDPTFYHEGKIYSTGHFGGDIIIRDANDGKELRSFKAHNQPISGLVKKDNHLITCCYDGSLKLWDIDHLNEGQEIKEIVRSKDKMFCYNCLILEGDRLFLGGVTQKMGSPYVVETIDLEKGTTNVILSTQHQPLCLAAQDNILIAGLHNNCIEVWDLSSRKLLHILKGNTQPRSLFFDGKKLFVGGNLGDITIWDIGSGKELSRICPARSQEINIKCISMQNGKLYCLQPNEAFLLDFNPSLSPYGTQLLEHTLAILGKMAHTKHEDLAKILHPDFQKLLAHHSMLCTRSLELTEKAILRVQTIVCIELLLDRLHSKDQKGVSDALDQLMSIDPHNILLYQLFNEKSGAVEKNWAELSFHGKLQQPFSLKEKEDAVLKFKKVQEDKWFWEGFLFVLELRSHQKLGHDFSQLKAHGILTFEDLNALGVVKTPFPNLKAEENDNKKEQIVGALKKLSKEVQDRFLASALGEGPANPSWGLFKRKFEVDIEEIGEKCQSPQSLAEYTNIIKKINAKIDKFNEMDYEDQFARLKTYIEQDGITAKWKALNYQGIFSLAEFAKNNPRVDLWDMGEKDND